MSWQGANIRKRSREELEEHSDAVETVEAAMNRLSTAYSTTMQVLAATHRAHQRKDEANLLKLANRVRQSFESDLLADPLIFPHAPLLSKLLRELAQGNDHEHWTFWLESRPTPPTLSSKSHKNTVKELSYLSLLNYSEILIHGSGIVTLDSSILDRGIVKPFDAVLWKDELKTILRVAMVALVDASELDPTDPILWLKLACVARQYGRMLRSDSPAGLLPYRRLERHALEQAQLAIPSNLPRNRLVERALKEWHEEIDNLTEYPPVLAIPETPKVVELPLTRYSWLTLGRSILRLCRKSLMGPHISIQLSPFLALPAATLQTICEFLDPEIVVRLECTCRALLGAIVSARASRDHSNTVRRNSLTHESPRPLQTGADGNEAVNPNISTDQGIDTSARESSQRASKRLLTQQITSGKRQERNERRSSLEYCFLAAILGCTSNDGEYRRYRSAEQVSTDKSVSPSPKRASSKKLQDENGDRQVESSLQSFIGGEMAKNPAAVLVDFLSYVALNTAQVYSSDIAGADALSMLLIEAMTILGEVYKETSSYDELWYSARVYAQSYELTELQLFAMDLLQVELRLRRCEADQFPRVYIDSDADIVCQMMPSIRSAFKALCECPGLATIFSGLRIRYLWLNSYFSFWKAKVDTYNKRELEEEGLGFIDETIAALRASGFGTNPFHTPHLQSRSRRGHHWKKLDERALEIFRGDIHASTRIHKGQDAFLDALNAIRSDSSATFQMKDTVTLASIGREILSRYSSPFDDPESRHSEIIDDLFETFRPELLRSIDEIEDQRLSLFENIIPLAITSKAQLLMGKKWSILSIVSVCLRVQNADSSLLVALLIRLTGRLSRNTRKLIEYYSASGTVNESDQLIDDLDSDDGRNEFISKILIHFMLLDCFAKKLHQLLKEMPSTGTATDDWVPEDCEKVILCVFDLVKSAVLCPSFPDFAASLKCLVEDLVCWVSRLAGLTGTSAKIDSLVRTKDDGLLSILVPTCDLLCKGCPFGEVACSFMHFLIVAIAEELSAEVFLRTNSYHERSSKEQLSSVCDRMLWLWSVVKGGGKDKEHGIIKLFWKERLKVPVASAFVGICGSRLGVTLKRTDCQSEVAEFDDFFDTDDSACEWKREDSSEEEADDETLLRAIAQATCSISLIIDEFDDEEAVSKVGKGVNGPLLAVSSIRVLTHLSERLIVHFQGDDIVEERRKWRDYPVGTRNVGMLIDVCLGKAFRWCHGIPNPNTTDEKESISVEGMRVFAPENLQAASHLYRYIMRVYSQGKKVPPRDALTAIRSALPVTDESSESALTRRFLFDRDLMIDLETFPSILDEERSDEGPFAAFKDWDFDSLRADNELRIGKDESFLVRRGISELLAQGPLHAYVEPQSENERREATENAEMELSQKFYAILEVMCLTGLDDAASWFKASQCLIAKADLIADRIGSIKNSLATESFSPDERSGRDGSLSNLVDLEIVQKQEHSSLVEEWTAFVGTNLSFFISHSWSSRRSLKRLSKKLMEQFDANQTEDTDNALDRRLFMDIESLYSRGLVAEWQTAWGGIFVSSIREVALRCLCFSLFTLKKKRDHASRELFDEIRASLGKTLYSTLQGGQSYGYPIRALTSPEIQSTAYATIECLKNMTNGSEEGLPFAGAEWDSAFLIGKCYEKIANTYSSEEFPIDDTTEERRYEYYYALALRAYDRSLSKAISIEKSGQSLAEGNGGSSHGSAEALYRLHASRIKCIIRAVQYVSDQRALARAEALRLTKMFRFQQGTVDGPDETKQITLWSITEDAIEALKECRKRYNFFHRSVYRHAQAILWGPYIRSESNVPEFKDGVPKVPFDESLEVLKVLFERRRSQLCSVWLTSTAYPSLFESINSSSRKYDSLRGKYIGGYIQLIRVCEKKDDIESIIRWTATAARDYPGYFWVTAKRGKQHVSHLQDSLLLSARSLPSNFFLASVKREANGALAHVLGKEVEALEDPDEKKLESNLKSAYACYLRLNCHVEDLRRRSRLNQSIQDVIDTLLLAFSKYDKGKTVVANQGWGAEAQTHAMIDAAIKKCRSLFPSVSQSYLTRKTYAKKRKSNDDSDKPDIDQSPQPQKTVLKTFQVSVPPGLNAGQSFETSVLVKGEMKKFRLTVPESNLKTIQFSIKIEVDGDAASESANA